MDRARAARGDAASVFGAGQPELLPDCPQQRRVRIDVGTDRFAVQLECNHDHAPQTKLNPAVVMGRERMRSPVAAAMALQTAALVGTGPISPIPPSFSPLSMK